MRHKFVLLAASALFAGNIIANAMPGNMPNRHTTARADTVMAPGNADNAACSLLKTNLLYIALLIPNVGVEFHVGQGWAIYGNCAYARWSNDKQHYYWHISGGELGVRRYFGHQASRKPFTGHHADVYAMMLAYDFELGGRGYMSGKTGNCFFGNANYAVGVGYGYSRPIGRRLTLDFSIGLGYMGGRYREYRPADGCYVWRATKQRKWFGPVKAEISLGYIIGGKKHSQGEKR